VFGASAHGRADLRTVVSWCCRGRETIWGVVALARLVRGRTIITLTSILLGKTKDTGNQWDFLGDDSPLFTSATGLARSLSAGSGTRRGVVLPTPPRLSGLPGKSHGGWLTNQDGCMSRCNAGREVSAFLAAKSDKAFDPVVHCENCAALVQPPIRFPLQDRVCHALRPDELGRGGCRMQRPAAHG
jgi:hypothetical protein